VAAAQGQMRGHCGHGYGGTLQQPTDLHRRSDGADFVAEWFERSTLPAPGSTCAWCSFSLMGLLSSSACLSTSSSSPERPCGPRDPLMGPSVSCRSGQ
jgi:hypothetical protein